MTDWVVVLRRCCPGRTMSLQVQAETEEKAKRGALDYANNRKKLRWKAWNLVSCKRKDNG